jgi:hypothetical protein
MRYEVTEKELTAIHNTRFTLSPGGAAGRMGMTRENVMYHIGQDRLDRGYLAWVYKAQVFGRSITALYIDLGPGGPDEPRSGDAHSWIGRHPREIVQESLDRYRQMELDGLDELVEEMIAEQRETR